MNLEEIRQNIIGEGVTIETPYGVRRLTYCDYAASGRGYRPIEQFICQNVLPFYGNTHTETTATGAQTTAFREEARDIIRRACRCTDDDAVIFTGSGTTGAVHALIGCLGLAIPCAMREAIGDMLACFFVNRPVVFVGSFEHHSNLLPWLEAEVEVVRIAECKTDGIDLDDLRAQLAKHQGRRLIGSFSAGSNVTGRLTDVRAIADCVHEAGGVVFFDYAAAGPYVDIDVAHADAIFLSMHKFVGGPGAPGVLVAKKSLFENTVPHQPGGGTVSFVSDRKHRYLRDVEHREEGGTPNIVGSIRAGLAMKLKMSVLEDVPSRTAGGSTRGHASPAIRAAQDNFMNYLEANDPDYRQWVNGVGLTLAGLHAWRGKHGDFDADNAEEAIHVGVLPGKKPVILEPFAQGARWQGFIVEVEEVGPFHALTAGGGSSTNVILKHEQDFAARVIKAFGEWGGIKVLGDLDEPRLGIVSFAVTPKTSDGSGKALHHNFVVALLNDLFGIQARGGNSCAAPYSHRLLGVSPADEDAIEACVESGWHGVKPGWTRLSFGWYDSEETLSFVINAVRFIARWGVCFLPDYTFDPKSGSWTCIAPRGPLMTLSSPLATGDAALPTLPESARDSYLEDALRIGGVERPRVPFVATPFEPLRWFWLPGEGY
jgi:selenocysteine lyase/cysteine desulfurase